jgi:hypothetical protein
MPCLGGDVTQRNGPPWSRWLGSSSRAGNGVARCCSRSAALRGGRSHAAASHCSSGRLRDDRPPGAHMPRDTGTKVDLAGSQWWPAGHGSPCQCGECGCAQRSPYLIDCGYGVTRQLIAAGISPQRERAILITHHHADHWTTTGREGVLRKTGADHRPLAQQQFPTWLAHILKRRILRGKSLSLCCCQNEHVQNFSFLIN